MIAATTLKYAAAWLVLMMSVATLLAGWNWPTYWRLAHRSASVQGTVIQVLPQVRAVRYRYDVGGGEYHGQEHPWQPNPPIARLGEGATLTVWYDPEEPGTSILGPPSAVLENETIFIALVAVALPTFILLAWRDRRLLGQ
jgi:hypothetical protein